MSKEIKLRLPQYSDDEVRDFHPFFAAAMENVLIEMGLNSDLKLIHHWSTKGFAGIIDFAIVNKKSNKVLLPIEIKKSLSDLRTLGRAQARGYLSSLGMYRGSDYYLASNLECVEIFRDSPERVLTIAQLLETENSVVGELSTASFDEFTKNLQSSLTEVLNIVRANDGTKYASNISGLLHALESSVNDDDSWHQAQSFYIFDYLRGALGSYEKYESEMKKWESAETYYERPSSLGVIANEIDFDLVYEMKIKGRFNSKEVSQIVAGAFDAGRENDLGSNLAAIVNEIAQESKKIPGIVETRAPLANILLSHIRIENSDPFLDGHQLLEPGCGSGNLILAAKQFFPSLLPHQILGVEKESFFREILGLRVGLAFIESMTPNSRPNLAIRNFESIPKNELKDVSVVAMNPPFIRGIDCVTARRELGDIISEVTGQPSTLTGDQLGYECGFLEYVRAVIPKNALIGTVFPTNSLTRVDSRTVREFLLNTFGLTQIITYRNVNVFGSVQKDTVILIGNPTKKRDSIVITKYLCSIDQLDLNSTENNDQLITQSTLIAEVDIDDLYSSLEEGWKRFLTVENSGEDILQELTFSNPNLIALGRTRLDIVRGSIGNSGASDFLFNSRTCHEKSISEVPEKWVGVNPEWIIPALKNSDVAPRVLDVKTGESGLCFPGPFDNTESFRQISSIVFRYLNQNQRAQTSGAVVQKKRNLDQDDVLSILKRSKATSGYLVLVPRAQRSSAQISISILPRVYVSTNFFIIQCENYVECVTLASWLLSVFGQIQLELSSINQEGMRKIEKKQLADCLVPTSGVSDSSDFKDLEESFFSSPAIKFQNIETRPVDVFWANKIFGVEAETKLKILISNFEKLVNGRLS